MERKTITQEYFALAVDKNGNIAGMYKENSQSGLVAAGMMDLLLNDIIKIDKKKITVAQELPDALSHLLSLYEYLKEKPRSTEKLMRDYMASTGARFKHLMADTGEVLLEGRCAQKGKGGLLGNKTIYIPEQDYKEKLAEHIRGAAKGETVSRHDMVLLCILQESKNLNRYLSGQEREEWKTRWKTMKKDPQSKQLAEMIHYISDMTAIIAACIMTGMI